MRTTLAKLVDRVAYYEWAYGHLGEQDSDIGPVGEFLVGKLLKCLPKFRSVNALFDLELKKGDRTIGIEVKTTSLRKKRRDRKVEQYEWKIRTQKACVEGRRELAPLWIFLAADFPNAKAASRRFDPFDHKYWRAWLATGDQIRASKVKNMVSESTLARLGVEPVPLAKLANKVATLLR